MWKQAVIATFSCLIIQFGVLVSADETFLRPSRPQKIKIRNIDDLINIGFDSLFPDESLTNETAYESIKFRLYTDPMNMSNYKELKISEVGLDGSNLLLKPDVPTKIFVHGFLAHCDRRIFPRNVIQAYLEQMQKTDEPMNLICVDWGMLANPSALPNPLLYGESVKSTRMVGEKMAEFLATLFKRDIVKDFSNFHLIGSSLGAHVAGISGHVLKTEYGIENKIGRITGLDPAGLFYRGRKAVDEKLDSNDAEYVDVIHTNMGQLGIAEVLGHADYFPNGGRFQERCFVPTNPIAMIAEQISGRCSHLIAANYYKESIQNPNITACKAESWDEFRLMTRTTGCKERVQFGHSSPSSSRGLFYLMM